MFDASAKPLETNIAETKTVLAEARVLGVSVEAEVGYVTGNEPAKQAQIGRTPIPLKPADIPGKTDPDEAERFASETGVDMLAVALAQRTGFTRSRKISTGRCWQSFEIG